MAQATANRIPVADHGKNPWLALIVLCMGFFMIVLDTTIVNIAIPSIIDGLRASLDSILWVLNSYILVYAILLITASRLGDRFGQRNLFVIGLIVFTLASAACGIAPDTNQLIVARIVQGIGGALLTPQTLAMISTIFPPERRGTALGVWGAVAGIAAIAGPTVGGLITTNFDWRWIFYLNVPVGILAVIGSYLFVPDLRPGRRHGFDLVGMLLSTASLFGIVFSLIEGQRYNWGTINGPLSIPLLLALGVALMVAFIFWESRASEPLVPLTLFTHNHNFAILNWVTAATAFGMLGLFLPLTIYLQSVLGMTAFQAGLAFAPMSLTSMLVAPLAGNLSDRIGGKYILMFGLGAFGLGMGGITFFATTTSTWATFLPWLILAGAGMGCTFAPATAVAMRNIEPHMVGAASGVFNTMRNLGGAIGSAVVGAVLQNRLAAALADQAQARSNELPAQLPPAVREKIIGTFSGGSAGLEVGRGQTGGGGVPAGLPPQAAAQIATYFHDVFAGAYINAMRPTLSISITVLLLAAASCLLIARRKQAAVQADEAREQAVVAEARA